MTPHSPWFAVLDGVTFGILYDPPVILTNTDSLTPESIRLHHISGIQKIVVSERVYPSAGLDPRSAVDQVWAELGGATFAPARLTVNGVSLQADHLQFRRHDFVFVKEITTVPIGLFWASGEAPLDQIINTISFSTPREPL